MCSLLVKMMVLVEIQIQPQQATFAPVLLTLPVRSAGTIVNRADEIPVGMRVFQMPASSLRCLISPLFIGACQKNTNTTFNCTCMSGWEGSSRGRKVDFCLNVRYLNLGVCRPLFREYHCECLEGSYSGRLCETTVDRVFRFQIIAKAFVFIPLTDILKYFFGIQPTYSTSTMPSHHRPSIYLRARFDPQSFGMTITVRRCICF